MADSLNVHYLSRKVHSLTGLLPVGIFLSFHLWENSLSRLNAGGYDFNDDERNLAEAASSPD